MPTRLDGFYVARYEGLNADARWGFGTLTLREGKVYGGDSLSLFMGEYEDGGDVVTARVKVFPLAGAYHSVTDVDSKPWDLPDIRGNIPKGFLLPNFEVRLDGQRYDTHNAVSVTLWRIVGF
jgi:hypothetical protein